MTSTEIVNPRHRAALGNIQGEMYCGAFGLPCHGNTRDLRNLLSCIQRNLIREFYYVVITHAWLQRVNDHDGCISL